MNVASSKQHCRRGFSLIEVILSTALLLGSVIVLNELVGIGRRHANRSELFGEAQAHAHQVVSEMLIGSRPLEPIQRQPLLPIFDAPGNEPMRESDLFGEVGPQAEMETDIDADASDPIWLYSVSLEMDVRYPELTLLEVTVEQSLEVAARPVSYSLRRWIRTESSLPGSDSEPLGANSNLTASMPMGQGEAP